MFFTILFIGNFEKLQKFKSTGNVLETSWNFMRCPPENECLNNHHSCDPVTQVCIDTLEGFECKCNDGKLYILSIYRNFGPANDVGRHMWLEGCPNPSKMEQSWECTFLRLFTHTNTKLASKTNSIIGLQRYQQASTANTAH